MRHFHAAWIGALFLVAALGVVLNFIPARAETEDREFWTEPDPGFVLVELSYLGANGTTRYRLFADGRLLTERLGRSAQRVPSKVFAAKEVRVSLGEMNSLLSDIVHAGLMEYDQEDVEARMGPNRRTIQVFDGATMFLTVALQHYRGPKMKKAGMAKVSIAFDNPSWIAPRFPEVEELQCLRRVGDWFRKYPILPRTEK